MNKNTKIQLQAIAQILSIWAMLGLLYFIKNKPRKILHLQCKI